MTLALARLTIRLPSPDPAAYRSALACLSGGDWMDQVQAQMLMKMETRR